MAVNETGLVGAIRRAVVEAYPDAWVFKTVGNPYQMAGVPDLLFCIEGLLMGLEAKHQKPGETFEHVLTRVTPLQRQQIQLINRAGGTAGVVTSVEDALGLVRRGLVKRGRRSDLRAT